MTSEKEWRDFTHTVEVALATGRAEHEHAQAAKRVRRQNRLRGIRTLAFNTVILVLLGTLVVIFALQPFSDVTNPRFEVIGIPKPDQPISSQEDAVFSTVLFDDLLPPDCIQADDPDKAIRTCSDFIQQTALSGKSAASAYVGRGFAFRAKNELRLAIADFGKAIEVDPVETTAYRLRAIVYDQKGEVENAIADFGEIIRLARASDPPYYLWQAYTQRASLHMKKGNFEFAIEDLTRSLDLNHDDDDPDTYHLRAWAFFRLNHTDQALSDAERSLELRPNRPATVSLRGRIFEALGLREEAIADFRRALSRDPNQHDSAAGLRRLGSGPIGAAPARPP